MRSKYPTPIALAAAGFVMMFVTCALAQEWTQTTAPSTNWSSIASSADGSKLIATVRGLFSDNVPIYISTNAGGTWQPSTASFTNDDWLSVASSADGGRLVASSSTGVYTSTNFGADWLYQADHRFFSLASSADGTRLIGADSFNVYTSTNSGAAWQLADVSGACVASSADGTKLATAYFAYPGHLLGGIFTSSNAGLDWTSNNAPLDFWTGWNALASSADGVKLAATIGRTDWPTGPGPIFVSTNGGATWQASGSVTSYWISVASSADGTTLVAAGSDGTCASADAGKNWKWATNVPPPNSNRRACVTCSADGKTLAVALEGGGIWISRSIPTPSLNLARAGANVMASWTVPSLDFVLQQNPNLSETNWTDVPISPVLNLTNLRHEVIAPQVWVRFFRLKH